MYLSFPRRILWFVLGLLLCPLVGKAAELLPVSPERTLSFCDRLTVSLVLQGTMSERKEQTLVRGLDRNGQTLLEVFLTGEGDPGIRFPQSGKEWVCSCLPVADGNERRVDMVVDGNRLDFYRDTHLAGIGLGDWHVQGDIHQWQMELGTSLVSGPETLVRDVRAAADVLRPTDEGERAIPVQVPAAHLAWQGNHGLVFDRYQRPVSEPEFPDRPYRRIGLITDADVHYAARLGFDHIKILLTSDSFVGEDGLPSPDGLQYLEQKVNQVLDTGTCCLICMHPEPAYKYKYLGTWEGFETLLRMDEQLGRFIDSHENWPPDRVALQLMTEPFANVGDWSVMTARQCEAARRGAPRHTLFLSSNDAGNIDALKRMEPVADDNVCYCFTTYEPYEFGFNQFMATQRPAESWWRQVGPIPWPASPERVAGRMTELLAEVPEKDWPEAERILTIYGQGHFDRDWLMERAKSLDEWAGRFGGKQALACVEFGCYLPGARNPFPGRGILPEERIRFLGDLRESFEAYGIRWSYWSCNESFTVYDPFVRKKHAGPLSDEEFEAWRDEALLNALGISPKK